MSLSEYVKGEGVAFPLAIARIMIGLMLLWAFFDKLIGLGFPTLSGQGWIDGGSPTYGFLSYSDGVFGWLFNSMAGYSELFDVVMMAGLLLIGIGLTLGIAMKLSTIFGSVLFFMFYLASLPIGTNPILDFHLVYIAVLVAIYAAGAGDCVGFGRKWRDTALVRRYGILE